MTLADDKKRWEAEILSPALERSPERKAEFEISSNIPLPRLLVPGDPDPDYAEKLGFPGEYPYTRGVQPTMYRGRFWTMRQYAGYASAQEFEPSLPLPARTWPNGPVRGFRSSHPDRVRRRRSHGAGRGGQSRRIHIFAG